MTNIVEFQSPAQLRKMVAEKDALIAELKAQLSAVSSTRDLLRLQVLDLKDQVHGHLLQMQCIESNLDNLLNKLDS